MFNYLVFVLLAVLLVLATGEALYSGLFRAHRPQAGTVFKAISGIISYSASALFWAAAYGWHYLAW